MWSLKPQETLFKSLLTLLLIFGMLLISWQAGRRGNIKEFLPFSRSTDVISTYVHRGISLSEISVVCLVWTYFWAVAWQISPEIFIVHFPSNTTRQRSQDRRIIKQQHVFLEFAPVCGSCVSTLYYCHSESSSLLRNNPDKHRRLINNTVLKEYFQTPSRLKNNLIFIWRLWQKWARTCYDTSCGLCLISFLCMKTLATMEGS